MYTAANQKGLDEHLKQVTKATSAFILVNNHFQMVSIFLGFSVGYPEWYLAFIVKFSALFGFQFGTMASPECTTGSLAYQWMWTLNTGLPLLVVIGLALASTQVSAEKRMQFIKTATLVVSFSFAPTLGSALGVNLCKDDGPRRVLVASPSIMCDASDLNYVYLASMAGLIGAIYFGGSTLGVWYSTGPLKAHFMQDHREEIGTHWVVATNLYKSFSVFSGAMFRNFPHVQVLIMAASAVFMAMGSRVVRPHEYIDDDNSWKIKESVAAGGAHGRFLASARRLFYFARDLVTLRPIHRVFTSISSEVEYFYETGNLRPNYAEHVLFVLQGAMLTISLLLLFEMMNKNLAAAISLVLFAYSLFVSYTCIQAHFKVPLWQAAKTEFRSMGKDIGSGARHIGKQSLRFARNAPGRLAAQWRSLNNAIAVRRASLERQRHNANHEKTFDLGSETEVDAIEFVSAAAREEDTEFSQQRRRNSTMPDDIGHLATETVAFRAHGQTFAEAREVKLLKQAKADRDRLEWERRVAIGATVPHDVGHLTFDPQAPKRRSAFEKDQQRRYSDEAARERDRLNWIRRQEIGASGGFIATEAGNPKHFSRDLKRYSQDLSIATSNKPSGRLSVSSVVSTHPPAGGMAIKRSSKQEAKFLKKNNKKRTKRASAQGSKPWKTASSVSADSRASTPVVV